MRHGSLHPIYSNMEDHSTAATAAAPFASSFNTHEKESTKAVAVAMAAASRPPLPAEEPNSTKESVRAAALKRQRLDGRSFEGMRIVCLRTHTLAAAAGSAFVSLGRTKVSCAVYGPRPSRLASTMDKGKIYIEVKFALFASNAATGEECADERALSSALLQALESVVLLQRYPKASLYVCIMVLEDDGCALSAALTCASLALVDASIEALDILTGATACGFTLLDGQKRLRTFALLDPTPEETRALYNKDFTIVDIGFCPGLASVCYTHSRGPLLLSSGCGQQLFSLCEAACHALAEEARKSLREAFIKRQKVGSFLIPPSPLCANNESQQDENPTQI